MTMILLCAWQQDTKYEWNGQTVDVQKRRKKRIPKYWTIFDYVYLVWVVKSESVAAEFRTMEWNIKIDENKKVCTP